MKPRPPLSWSMISIKIWVEYSQKVPALDVFGIISTLLYMLIQNVHTTSTISIIYKYIDILYIYTMINIYIHMYTCMYTYVYVQD